MSQQHRGRGPRRTKTTSATKQVSAGLLRLGSFHGLGLVGLGWQDVCTGSLVLQLGEISRKIACRGLPFPDARKSPFGSSVRHPATVHYVGHTSTTHPGRRRGAKSQGRRLRDGRTLCPHNRRSPTHASSIQMMTTAIPWLYYLGIYTYARVCGQQGTQCNRVLAPLRDWSLNHRRDHLQSPSPARPRALRGTSRCHRHVAPWARNTHVCNNGAHDGTAGRFEHTRRREGVGRLGNPGVLLEAFDGTQ